MAKSNGSRTIAPYLPYETFTSEIAHLKATAVPSRIDKDAFPREMHSLQRGQVQSAMKFLGLIDAGEYTRDTLRELVAAYGTEAWTDQLRDLVSDKYVDIIGDLDLDTATQKQLDERFGTVVSTDQMLMKSVRFYLAMLTDAGLTFSPHFGRGRRNATTTSTRKNKPAGHRPAKKKQSQPGADSPKVDATPGGMIDIPIPIGTALSFVRVPRDITTKQIPLVKAAYGVVEALAAQNTQESE